ALLVIGLFITLGIGMFRVAYNTTDTFVVITAGAIMTWLLGQTFMNIAMVTGLMPILCVPLPFIASGGSSLLLRVLAGVVVLSFSSDQAQVMQDRTRQAQQPTVDAKDDKASAEDNTLATISTRGT